MSARWSSASGISYARSCSRAARSASSTKAGRLLRGAAARGEPDRGPRHGRRCILLRQLLVEPAIGNADILPPTPLHARDTGSPVRVDLELGASCRLRNGRSRSRLGSALAREPRAHARTCRALRRARLPRTAPIRVVEERPEPVARLLMGCCELDSALGSTRRKPHGPGSERGHVRGVRPR